VIASQVGGLARLVQHRQNGLFFDGSLEDLYKKYKELVENNKLRDKLVKNALQEVRTKYSWQAITKQLIGYYQEIIAKYRSKKL
jgi:glycosyltransferase involved in cell wall biosynthesis